MRLLCALLFIACAASAQQAGAFQFEGAMVDAPVLARARQYLRS